jgi:hypothetical protein
MLPSDPGYIPAATDERVLACEFYRQLLGMNTDPYASHSRDPGLIEVVEEFAMSKASTD